MLNNILFNKKASGVAAPNLQCWKAYSMFCSGNNSSFRSNSSMFISSILSILKKPRRQSVIRLIRVCMEPWPSLPPLRATCTPPPGPHQWPLPWPDPGHPDQDPASLQPASQLPHNLPASSHNYQHLVKTVESLKGLPGKICPKEVSMVIRLP